MKGRASRSEFWYFFIFYLILGIPTYYFDNGWILFFFLVLLIPFITVTVRRLHDIGLNGYWVGSIWILGVIFGRILPEEAGEAAPYFIWTLMFVIFIFCTKAGEGNNKYGKKLKD